MDERQLHIFAEAERCLAGDGDAAHSPLLRWLCGEDTSLLEGDADFLRLLRVAKHLNRFFELPILQAPGLFAFGAEISPGGQPSAAGAGVSGLGWTRLEAFRRCLGEAAEYVSQFPDEDGHSQASEGQLSPQLRPGFLDLVGGTVACDTVGPVHRFTDTTGAGFMVPSAMTYREKTHSAPALPYPMSIGCAAARDMQTAKQAGVLEWIERDAAALWWLGCKRGAPLALEAFHAAGIAERIAEARAGQTRRKSWFLDISVEADVPVIAALSFDDRGENFAFGFGSGKTVGDAMRSAFLELCQMELADQIVDAKMREGGEERLNPIDHRHLERRQQVRPTMPILHPIGAPRSFEGSVDPESALASIGFTVLHRELTRPDLGVPVVRTIVPGLQPFPSTVETRRLRECIATHDQSLHNHKGIRLV